MKDGALLHLLNVIFTEIPLLFTIFSTVEHVYQCVQTVLASEACAFWIWIDFTSLLLQLALKFITECYIPWDSAIVTF